MQSLSNRLMAVASLVKKGSRVVDVGTDHGFIPVYLCQKGIIESAVACDINKKPLASCEDFVMQ
jgi:tRNA (adenine22-N1)-methyltransferase